jgi:broad specificity phosphatase PhoE
MADDVPSVYLARHGETEWSRTGQHTGLTDLPLTADGEAAARRLGERLRSQTFARVFTSPLQRAHHTCRLAGFGDVALVVDDLVEWNYGRYEGLTTQEIRRERPNWHIFEHGCPEGEAVADVAARADRVVAKLRAVDGDVLVFSSGHLLRMLSARWLGLSPLEGAIFHLDTASLSILGYERTRDEPVVRLWNSCDA